jgi:hypothetical protein
MGSAEAVTTASAEMATASSGSQGRHEFELVELVGLECLHLRRSNMPLRVHPTTRRKTITRLEKNNSRETRAISHWLHIKH